MNIRYFEKRGTWWMDFKDAQGKRRRVPTGETTQLAAEKASPAILARVLTESAPAQAAASAGKSGKTLEATFKLGMKTREKWIGSKDKKSLEHTYEALAAYWGKDRDMADLNRANVLEWRTKELEKPGKRKGDKMSPSSINHKLSMMSVLLEVAELPPHTVKHLSTRGNERRRRVMDEEIRKLQAWLLTPTRFDKERVGGLALYALIPVALHTAARLSELLDLKWGDVYLDTEQPFVIFRKTKDHGNRNIPLSAVATNILKGRRHGPAKHLPGPFADLNEDRVTALWEEGRKALGLEDDHEFVFHALRHEGLSRIADSENNAYLVRDFAGHADISTSQRYVHSSAAALQRAASVFDR